MPPWRGGRLKKKHRDKFTLLNLKGNDHLKDIGVDGKIMLEWVLKK
jgi:hypothetical protein